MEVSEEEKNQIREFNQMADEFFVSWFNATVDSSALNNLQVFLDEEVRILYSQIPDKLMTKNDLFQMLPQMYGRTKDNPISRYNEYRHWLKLGEDKVLVQFQEHTLQEGEVTRTRALSVIFKTSEPMKLLYSHE